MRCGILCLLLLFHLLEDTRGDQTADLTRNGRSLTEYRGPSDGSLLVVTLLGGHVVAVRPDSGDVLWEYDTGKPLLRVSQGKAMPPGLHMLSGVDGGLYLYGSVLPAAEDGSGDGGGGAAAPPGPTLERLPITLPELVDTSPSLTDDGSIITGERRTRVFALDRHTGALLHVFSEGAGKQAGGPLATEAPTDPHLRPPGASPGFGMEDVPVLQMLDPERILLVGRQDFAVRSKQVLTDVEAWNATYSRIINLRPAGLGATARVPPGGGGPGGTAGALPLFAVGADHSLQAYDPASLRRRWAVRFKTPPVGVFAAEHGDTNFLDPTAAHSLLPPDTQQPTAAAAQRRHRQQRAAGAGAPGPRLLPFAGTDGEGGGADGSGADGGASVTGGIGGRRNLVLVGELKGSLYAMPAEHVVLDERVEAQPWSAFALPGPASDPPLPLLPASSSASGGGAAADKALVIRDGGISGGGGSSSKDLVTYAMDVETGEGVVSGLACRPPGLQLLATVGEPSGVRQSWLPDAPKPLGGAGGGGLPLPGAVAGGAGAAATTLAALTLGAGGGLLSVILLAAAGLGAAAVLIVLHFRGDATARAAAAAGADGGGKVSTATATVDVAAAAVTAHVTENCSGVTGGEAGAKSGGAAAAATGRNGGGGAQGGGGRGAGAGQRRRKGHAGEAGGGGGGGASGGGGTGTGASPSGPGALPSIEEDRQLSPSEAPLRPLSALLSPPSSSSSSSASSAAHLSSAEPRVRHREDGSLVIGRLVVGPAILGYGSAGTVVYEGVLDGRPVAVKRLLRQFTELARKEIEVLILSDEHPNVVRCFALEEDREFVYLALERCRSTLSDALDSPQGRAAFVDPDTGQPTARCISMLLDVCRGLAALHERGIVHRDLKPHNVLLTESGARAKLSDMGLCKQLVPEQSSFDVHQSHHGPGGSSGWQAPEQLIARDGGAARQTRSMDVFSLGCILYYCMAGGRHPFGDNHYERDVNILNGAPSLGPLAATAGPEAAHLVAACLAKDPARRPPVGAILSHPLWWGDERRLAFLVDISDRVENEDREPDTSLLDEMESYARVALAGPGAPGLEGGAAPSTSTSGAGPTLSLTAALTAALSSGGPLAPHPNWGAALPPELVANLGRYRRYDYTSVRDLLRVVRNKRNHFREMPPALQSMLGPLPGGFLRFFAARFPRLLLAVYVFALRHLADEPALQQYWGESGSGGGGGGGAEAAEPFVQTFLAQYGNGLKPIKAAQQQPPQQQQQQQQQQQHPSSQAPPETPGCEGGVGPAAAAPSTAAAVSAVGAPFEMELGEEHRPNRGSDDGVGSGSALPTAAADAALAPVSTPTAAAPPLTPSPPPLPPAARPSGFSISASATFGGGAPAAAGPPPPPPSPAVPPPLVLVGYEPCGDDGEVAVREFPRRPGKQQCEFYVKTGHCKFGETCVFDHPEAFAVRLTALGLPLRPEEQICTFYLKNNDCRFGPACKFHHPMLRPVFAGSAAAAVAAAEGGGGKGQES